MKTVVVTGYGTINPLGDNAQSMWEAMLAGRSGVTTLDYEWAHDLPVRIAAQIHSDISQWIPRVQARRMDRVSQLALVAARQAWEHAGFDLEADTQVDTERLGVCIGTGIGGLITTLDQWDNQRDKGARRLSPFTIPMLMANAPAAHVGLMVSARAGVHAPVSACASSNEAIAWGMQMISSGHADVVIVGGSESTIHPMPVNSFAQMQALSKRNDAPEQASRPWDRRRDGFVMGEGAACLVIESYEHAQSRKARIYATLAGYGMSADAHDLVQPDPSGEGQYSAMVKALEQAHLSPSDLYHVNAHGTSTPQGDITEANSIARALGSSVDHVLVTSTKSMTGHLLGAAGALETLATIFALNERTVPPTINLDDPEDLPIHIAAHRPHPLKREGRLAALNNSFGFGGHNVAVAITNDNVN